MHPPLINLVAVALAAVAAPVLFAQDPTGELREVEQGVADLGILSTSLRVVEGGLALPQGFQQLYQLPGEEGQLMRGSGALYAVFPRSSYINTRYGELATIPAGTVFSIGLPPELRGSFARTADAAPRSPLQVDMRNREAAPIHAVRTETEVRRPRRLSDPSPPPIRAGGPAIIIDEQYRETRLRELLERAASHARR